MSPAGRDLYQWSGQWSRQWSGEWGGIEWWRRWLLPSDFASQTVLHREETLECRKLVTESLTLEETRKTATLKVGDARKYDRAADGHTGELGNQPWDLESHPWDLGSRRVTLIENEERVPCAKCRGKGRLDCSPQTPCPGCKGRRTRNEFCFACGGSGRAGHDNKEQCWSCGGKGTRSEDCAVCAGVYANSTGRVRCKRCNGMGWVVCRPCAGAGEKVRARLVTRHYTRSAEYHYQLGGLATDRFSNGLAPRHFKHTPEGPVHREFQAPAGKAVALQRLSIFSFAVESKTYRYRGADFHVNRIAAGSHARLITCNLPWSRPRLASAGIAGCLAACSIAALLLAL